MYLEEENSSKIVEIEDIDLDFGLENRPADPYLKL